MTGSCELRLDNALTDRHSTNVATIDEIRSLHDVISAGDGEGITVAIMDSGIDDGHPLFDGMDIQHYNAVTDEDFDEGKDFIGHGTACAGLVAQLAPKADLVSVRIFGSQGTTGTSPIKNGYRWLIDHSDEIDVVNMSWGARRNIPTINEWHQTLLSHGVIDSVAAGNTGADGGSPATAPSAFSAGALTEDGTVARFSSFDPKQGNPDIAAVGVNVKLARAAGTAMGSPINTNWTKASGTSFAAPIMSGLLAKYASCNRQMPADKRFTATAKDIEVTPRDGAGIAKYDDALAAGDSGNVIGGGGNGYEQLEDRLADAIADRLRLTDVGDK